MIPLYKLLSLLLRVFSRPFINYTKRYHATQTNSRFNHMFLILGNNWHHLYTHINRKYLKVVTNMPMKYLAKPLAIYKGIEMFYEIVFYTIAIGFPIYYLYRGAVDTKKKEAKMTERLNRLDDKFTLIETYIDQISSLTSLAKHPNDVLLEATLESLLLPHHLHIG